MGGSYVIRLGIQVEFGELGWQRADGDVSTVCIEQLDFRARYHINTRVLHNYNKGM